MRSELPKEVREEANWAQKANRFAYSFARCCPLVMLQVVVVVLVLVYVVLPEIINISQRANEKLKDAQRVIPFWPVQRDQLRPSERT